MTTLHRTTILAGALLVGAALVAPAVAGHSGHGSTVHVTLEAGEGGDCSGDKTYCFSVLEGDLSKVEAGASVELTLENPTDNSINHNAHVTGASNAAANHENTPASVAFANTTDVTPGGSDTINFTVPQDVSGTYIWCDITGHESGGMWLKAGAAASDGGGGDGGGTNGSPGFTALGALAGVGLALVAARRLD